jgi:hypothetical protein
MRILRLIIGIAVVVAVGLAWGIFRGKDLEKAAPGTGQCLWVENSSSTNPKLHKVDCGDSKATYKVLKKVTGTSSDSACDSVAGTEAEYVGTATSNGSTTGEVVLCLASNK